MNNNISIQLDKAYYVRSLISYYPLSHSILPVPDGLSVVIFESKKDINDYFQMRGINDTTNFEILRIGSFYDFMKEVSNIGFIGIWYYNNFPIFFCNYLADIDLELPSFAYIPNGQFIGASGELDSIKHFELWRNFSKTDKIIKRNVRYVDESPLDPQSPVFTIIAAYTPKKDPVIWSDACPLKGPYVNDLGASCLFTDEEFAINYLQSKELENNPEYIIEKLENVFSFLDLINSKLPFIDIGLNPGNERFLQGYFFESDYGWVLRTVVGNYLLRRDNSKLLKINSTDNLNNEINLNFPKDTIGNPNTVDSSLREIQSTIKYPLKQIFGSTISPPPKTEADKLIHKIINNSKYMNDIDTWFSVVEANHISIDSFLIFGFDKINGNQFNNNEEMIGPYVFSNIVDAILYFYHHYFNFEYDLRLNGYSLCHRHIEGSSDKELEQEILSNHKAALKDLMERIITKGYKAEHAELLKLYINRICSSLEIEECGYLGDLAIYQEPYIEKNIAENDSSILKKIYKSTKKHRNNILSQIGFEEKYQNKIRLLLGNSYDNLSVDSLCILESAIKQFENNQQRINHDYAGISMKLCKVFERELSILIFKNWRSEYLKNKTKAEIKKIDKEAYQKKDETVKRITGWLLKKRKLELGPMTFIIKRTMENCDQEVLMDLKKYIQSLKNSDYILSEDFLTICKLISNRYRNGGVHEHIVTYEICQEAFDEILFKNNNCLKFLTDI